MGGGMTGSTNNAEIVSKKMHRDGKLKGKSTQTISEPVYFYNGAKYEFDKDRVTELWTEVDHGQKELRWPAQIVGLDYKRKCRDELPAQLGYINVFQLDDLVYQRK